MSSRELERRLLLARCILIFLLAFVFIYGLTPADPRIRMGFKPFAPEFDFGPAEIWYSVKKWRHILWFAIFFPLSRFLFEQRSSRGAGRRALIAVLVVSFLIEFEECFTAGRHGRVTDFLPNLIGTGLYLALERLWPLFWPRLRKILE